MALSTTTSGGGTVTSFSNTPQAQDDLFTATALALQGGLTEDSLSSQTFILNVMANDLAVC